MSSAHSGQEGYMRPQKVLALLCPGFRAGAGCRGLQPGMALCSQGLCLLNALLFFFVIFAQGRPEFHFALGPSSWATCAAQGLVPGRLASAHFVKPTGHQEQDQPVSKPLVQASSAVPSEPLPSWETERKGWLRNALLCRSSFLLLTQ